MLTLGKQVIGTTSNFLADYANHCHMKANNLDDPYTLLNASS
jgi:hypothetical protein